ncbi:hypothetical protein [Lactococcus muris]|uniref:hypothetical protein n=1 Tax=Lactococcus muris TaxID=2941330 RepID=UPI00230108F9
MDWKDIVKQTGIEVIWIDKEYSEKGSYIPKCSLYPNGAIILNLNTHSDQVEYIALHEIGHLVSGKSLSLVNKRLVHLEHCRNEAKANRFLLRKIAPDFVEANEYNRIWATPEKLCTCLGLRNTFENLKIAQEEIDDALWNAL